MEPIPAFALEEIVARLGHELRNPLSSIQSGIQLAQVLTPLSDEAAALLDGALAEIGRIDAILRDTHSLVRMAPAHLRPCRLAEAIESCASRHRSRTDWPAIRVEGPATPFVETDPELLQVVLDALTARALAITPAAGEVLIRWDAGESTPTWIEVQDGGPGSAHGSSLTLRWLLATWPGSEFGLHLAARACTLLGGHLALATVHPQGHRIRMELPRG